MTQTSERPSPNRAHEIENLIQQVQSQLRPFIRAADGEFEAHKANEIVPTTSLLEPHSPFILSSRIALSLPTEGQGSAGFLCSLQSILQYSVNTFAPGFLDKLYASTNAPGIAADLILSVLNTNVHVYQVSPVLTLVEKHTTKALAVLFGLTGPRAGGISVQGGSSSNTTSIVVARNTLYPLTKTHGNSHDGLHLVLFTSSHGHYSIEKAAQACGFGSAAVVSVPVDPVTRAMDPEALESLIVKFKADGKTPFFINATAGSTVLGSFDPFTSIGAIAKQHNCWFHIDGSWGGSFIFSSSLRSKLSGSHLADSIAINPHKMLGVPLTCSFLLARDLRTFQKANTLKAGYLFHNDDDDEVSDEDEEKAWVEPDDLADLTLQCGRRGDSLKLFLSWQYYGTSGYAAQVENAYNVATYLAEMVSETPELMLVSERQPPCLQICFYFAPLSSGRLLFGWEDHQIRPAVRNGSNKALDPVARVGKLNGKVTKSIAKMLVSRGFMIDFAPALEGQGEVGSFLRVVVNVQTIRETMERLIREILEVGNIVVEQMKAEHRVDQYEINGAGFECHRLNELAEIGKKMLNNPAEKGHGPVVRRRETDISTC